MIRLAAILAILFLTCPVSEAARQDYPVEAEFFKEISATSRALVGHHIRLSEVKFDQNRKRESLYFQWLRADNINFSNLINALEDLLRIEQFHADDGQYCDAALSVVNRFVTSMQGTLDDSLHYSRATLAKIQDPALIERAQEHNLFLERIKKLLERIGVALDLAAH